MKFEEVLPLARDEGMKIRRRGWSDGSAVWWVAGKGLSYDGDIDDLCSIAFAETDWEVAEENPHPEGGNLWAVWWLERGKVLTLGDGALVFRSRGPLGGILDWNPVRTWYIRYLAATDWRLVDGEET